MRLPPRQSDAAGRDQGVGIDVLLVLPGEQPDRGRKLRLRCGRQRDPDAGAGRHAGDRLRRREPVTVVNGPGVSENYAYRPDGKRVWRRQANGVEEVYFYGLEGEKLWQLTRAFPSGTHTWRLHYYFAGKLVARSDGEGVVTDRLGTVTMRAPPQGPEYFGYHLYGEEWTTTGAGAGEVRDVLPGRHRAGLRPAAVLFERPGKAFVGRSVSSQWGADQSAELEPVRVRGERPGEWVRSRGVDQMHSVPGRQHLLQRRGGGVGQLACGSPPAIYALVPDDEVILRGSGLRRRD